ncbi:hypothetical protein J2X12_002852 [Pseudarthrobacter oxydans]|uniref:Uncharacterized protein n=1 Tax=Pseudarthrobacter oxydans TaxID=1671 RepID=A0AAW8ND35_PSEOX|nr:hypothetical protein [Pseudarthrobacter oxydans]MDR6794841.1 hypothetical protein [Pseudarthrobacter oxydans]MDR7164814.1 hypothetical protein [Pseudarthrobacter oxydans]
MSDYIVDEGDKVALRDELGHDVAWGDLQYGDANAEQVAEFNEAYELLEDEYHTDGDLYQGSTLMRVIRRKADDKLFGFAFWQGGGKYGEADIEPNGDDHGFPSKYDWEDGVDKNEAWYVFRPIELAPLPAYKFIADA